MFSNHPLVSEGQALLAELSSLQGQRFFYNLLRSGMSGRERSDLSAFEKFLSPLIDVFSNVRLQFAQWSLNGDSELGQYRKTPQISSFMRERNKLQRMLDARRPNGKLLISKMNQLLLESALRNASLPPPKPITERSHPRTQRAILVEKGRPFSTLAELEEIFLSAKGYIIVIDKWISNRSLDFLWRAPNVPIRFLTGIVEERSRHLFEIAFRRMREERGDEFEIRICQPKELYDRYILTRDEFWTLGPSLKDAGSKTAGSVTEITNQEHKSKIKKQFEKLWNKSSLFSSEK